MNERYTTVTTGQVGVERERAVFEYALLRVVPRLERGECVNAGVILYCQERAFLASRSALDEDRLRAVDPGADVPGVRRALAAVEMMCAGGVRAGAAGRERPGPRFRWLTAPRSTIVQPGPIHGGLTEDPEAEVERLLDCLVR
ncbi:hypothetical protein GCM10007079_21270 [Nocardiopsis terrae]|uniref:DUF3037 domain-containing protein n=1 Tax=Nocardiopsis terrae TaxID=372655 RepID=A0ABR9HGV3_9ACTN|nr:DUF3037 domain-containing protein [Nocardiopsis terrae]MBE1458259.1 hypothetical protein [Nocardiopsis terrae]GHC81395.1 hypothetical protein GCM10007079_21270 [Nocardiopsis terrae]